MPLFLLIGLTAGVLSGVFGIGGGLIIVPALITLGKLSPHTAVGTSLTALLLPVGLVGAWTYWKAGSVNIAAAGWVALGLALGVGMGAWIALQLPADFLRKALAVLLALVAVKLWWA